MATLVGECYLFEEVKKVHSISKIQNIVPEHGKYLPNFGQFITFNFILILDDRLNYVVTYKI